MSRAGAGATLACSTLLSVCAGMAAHGAVAVAPGARARADVPATGMAVVPAGWFALGSNPAQVAAARVLCMAHGGRRCTEDTADESPSRRIWLPAFAIDRAEVTFDAYRRCEAAGRCNPSRHAGAGDAAGDVTPDERFDRPGHPVVGVSWADAAAYCEFVGKRLPSEAEWEKAARGPDGWTFPWGDAWDPARANHGRAETPTYDATDGFRFTAPAGAFAGGASPYGVADLAGNVWEWVADWYDREAYALAPEASPTGPRAGHFRVLRGGAWNSPPHRLRAAARGYAEPAAEDPDIGFRCLAAAPPSEARDP